MSELEIGHVHACALTGSVGRDMISGWYPVWLDWCFLCVCTLRFYILVSSVFISIQLLWNKLLIQP